MGKNTSVNKYRSFLSELYTSVNYYRSFFICLQCYKQPPGSILCGYYVCEVLRNNGRYRTNPEDVSLLCAHNYHVCANYGHDGNVTIFIYCVYVQLPTIDGSWGRLGEKELTNICADMARFILREICHEDGEFFDKEGVLSLDEAKSLRRWAS